MLDSRSNVTRSSMSACNKRFASLSDVVHKLEETQVIGLLAWVGKWDVMCLQHPDIHDPGIQHEPPNNSHLPDAQIRLHKTHPVWAHRGDGHAGHNDINAVAFQCRDEFFPGEFDKSDGAP